MTSTKQLSNTAQERIEHAMNRDRLIQWTRTGIWTSDGKSLTMLGLGSNVKQQTLKTWLGKNCVRLNSTSHEKIAQRKSAREARYRKLAHVALDKGLYDSAEKLASKASWARREAEEIRAGRTVYLRISS